MTLLIAINMVLACLIAITLSLFQKENVFWIVMCGLSLSLFMWQIGFVVLQMILTVLNSGSEEENNE